MTCRSTRCSYHVVATTVNTARFECFFPRACNVSPVGRPSWIVQARSFVHIRHTHPLRPSEGSAINTGRAALEPRQH
ncbi:hypothetical protein BJV74DRAFT_93983 [Russula compacta]|nr:hypothetical protein BJV74DRAFT_93983 [Russula compacta]